MKTERIQLADIPIGAIFRTHKNGVNFKKGPATGIPAWSFKKHCYIDEPGFMVMRELLPGKYVEHTCPMRSEQLVNPQ